VSLVVLLLGLTATGLILLRFELGQMPKRKRKQGTRFCCAFCLTMPISTLLQLPFPAFVCSFPAKKIVSVQLHSSSCLHTCLCTSIKSCFLLLQNFMASSLHMTESIAQTVTMLYTTAKLTSIMSMFG